jgi:hypothetical protein
MTDPDWLPRVPDTLSFRRIFMLAKAICSANRAPKEVRRTARRIVGLLTPIIDKPIAPAARLAMVRLTYKQLVAMIERTVGKAPDPDCHPRPETAEALNEIADLQAHREDLRDGNEVQAAPDGR